MELKLNHLTPYLDSKLKVIYRDEVWELVVLDKFRWTVSLFNQYLLELVCFMEIKPILKPLKEINYDNYIEFREFIGEEKWDNSYTQYFNDLIDNFENVAKLIQCAPQAVFEYFVSKHYDVFNLIPNGLAIDINSINQTSK
jgi:hypothetical protein